MRNKELALYLAEAESFEDEKLLAKEELARLEGVEQTKQKQWKQENQK